VDGAVVEGVRVEGVRVEGVRVLGGVVVGHPVEQLQVPKLAWYSVCKLSPNHVVD
jgi:hypothetical protein